MLLLLGTQEAIHRYTEEMLENIDPEKDIVYVPDMFMHHTEFDKQIQDMKESSPPIISTQSKEYIEALLDSNLDFNVTTAFVYNGDLLHRDVDKAMAIKIYYNYGLELR